jgi:hypothetical protein
MVSRGKTDFVTPLPLAHALPPSAKGSVAATRRVCKPMPVILIAMALVMIGGSAANAENPEISHRRASERTDFTNDETKDGFFKIAIKAELQIGAPVERVRKFDAPVRIFVDSKALPDRRSDIASIVADIRSRVNHLDVAVTDDRQTANFVVRLVAERDLGRTIRSLYGSDRAKQNSAVRFIRNACPASARTSFIAFAGPKRSFRSMPESLRSMTAHTKSCCRGAA